MRPCLQDITPELFSRRKPVITTSFVKLLERIEGIKFMRFCCVSAVALAKVGGMMSTGVQN